MDKLDRLDKIIVSEEAHQRINTWAEANRNSIENKQIPLNEGLLVLHADVAGVKVEELTHFKLTEQGLTLTAYLNTAQPGGGDNVKAASITVSSIEQTTNLNIKIHHERFEAHRSILQTTLTRQFLLLMDAFLYMQHHVEYVKSERKSVAVVKKPKKKGKRSGFTTARLSRTIYEFDYTPREGEKRAYNRKTESWRQRGHWRRYKSGKTVWIEPVVKGSKKNVKPKTYRA